MPASVPTKTSVHLFGHLALLLGCAALSAITGAACVPVPRGPVDLHRVEARAVHFGLASPRSAICPGEPVRLNVMLDVVDADDPDDVPRRLVPHRHEIDDAIFDFRQLHLSSNSGVFDQDGTFHPDADVRTSVQTGFVLHARPPNGPAFAVRFPPSYECTARIGETGKSGAPGDAGGDAAIGDDDPDVDSRSSEPYRPAMGGPGQPGGPGSEGPRFTVFVTWVKTPDYTKLLAARAVGDVDRLTLVAPGTPLEVFARGGDGGPGGAGGEGGTATEPGQMGGRGGQGGTGGAGGKGGSVHVVLDERFGDLEGLVTVDVRGGSGGRGGVAGRGGSGAVEDRPNSKGRYVFRVRTGQQGPPGAYGPIGASGPYGRTSIVRGDVRTRFEGLGAIVPL